MDYLANILASIYIFDIHKIEDSFQKVWDEYQKLLNEAEKTKDITTISKARAYLYFLGYFIIEDFGKGAIERRLSNFEPKIKFEDFVTWLDSNNIPGKYQQDELFQKIVQFYEILKSYKNKTVNGSYLDEDRFNKIYAEILDRNIQEISSWEIKKRELKGQNIGADIKEIKGVVASSGFCQGSVFLIENEEDLHQFPDSSILVAVITYPSYLTAMKKSIGIISDLGGIMSHPAIVARELGIPCVVGTKIATQVLKTGDLVEVDANNGIVKILNKVE